jgi:exosome complex exonuclease DIS3/RRP44
MPSGPVDFRVSCGTFVFVYVAFMGKRAKRARQDAELRRRFIRPRTRLEGVFVGLVLSIFLTSDLLLRVGNVETNPGPVEGREGARSVQTRLTAAAGGRAASSGAERRASTTKEPTLGDLMAKLTSMETSMHTNFGQVREDFQEMKNEVIRLSKEVQNCKEKVDDLEKENEDLQNTNKNLLDRVDKLESLVDDLEGRSRRNNILVHGLTKEEEETQESMELRLRELFTDKLDLVQDIEMDRVHRLGSKDNSPIIARCTFYKDKVSIMKAKAKLKGSDIFVGEDFSRGVREKRKKLSPFLKDIRQEDKTARLVHDHIVVGGRKLFLDSDEKGLVER